MFYRFGKYAVMFRWPIIIMWAGLFMLALPFALRAPSHLKSGFGTVDTESRAALDILVEEFDATESTIALVFASDTLTVYDRLYRAGMERVLSPILEIPEVKEVTTFYNSVGSQMVSDDGHTTFALISLDLELDEAMDLYPHLKQSLEDAVTSGGELKIWATGGIPIFSDLNVASERDIRRGEAVSLPLVLIALLIVFGGLVAAGLPVVMGAISVSIALATLFLLAQVTDVSIFALNIVSFLGLGVAIDYSLLVVTRFREELEDWPKDEAVARTTATAGRALLFAGVTSILGLSGLLLFDFMMLRSIGMGGILVILISFLAAMTLLPAILAVLGHKVNRLSLITRRPRVIGKGFWHNLASWVMVHPFLVAIPLIIFLVLLGTPFLGVKLGAPWSTVLPPDAESRQGWDVLSAEMGPGTLAPIVVVARSSRGILAPDAIGYLYEFSQSIQHDSRVDRVESLVSLDPSMRKEDYQSLYSSPEKWDSRLQQLVEEFASDRSMVIRVFSRSPPMADETKELVKAIRSTPLGNNLQLLVTGATADLEDSIDVMYRDFPKVVVFVMISIYVALFILFRSVLLPLNPNPPKDTDGRREDSGRGWVRELQGRWPGVLG